MLWLLLLGGDICFSGGPFPPFSTVFFLFLHTLTEERSGEGPALALAEGNVCCPASGFFHEALDYFTEAR